MNILLVGSIAYDRILDFHGNFSDHILPEKIHKLQVAFFIQEMKERWGGTAGNIAYNLALLGHTSSIVATAGKDFGAYEAHLQEYGVDLSRLEQHNDVTTAVAHLMGDMNNSQIIGFYPGAMQYPTSTALADFSADDTIISISPSNMDDMMRYAREAREQGIRFVCDPGQQTTLFDAQTMKDFIHGAWMLVVNDYEYELIKRTTGFSDEELRAEVEMLVITLGAEGAVVYTGGTEHRIPSAPAGTVEDVTGAGDAFRAGLYVGLLAGMGVDVAGRIGALVASYTIEHHGTQEHRFTFEEFAARYAEAFGQALPLPAAATLSPAQLSTSTAV